MTLMKEPVYYFEVTAENCRVDAFINGFPFYELQAKYKTYFACPMNIGLIEGENEIEVVVAPALGDVVGGDGVKPPEAKIELKLYENKTVSGPEHGEVLESQTVSSFMAVKVPFENQTAIDFSAFFDSLEPVEDEKELLDFVRKLTSKGWAGDVGFFQQAFDFKLEQYAKAYYENPNAYKTMAMDFLTRQVLGNLPEDYLEQVALTVLKPYNDKKIWHAMLPDGEEILFSQPDEDGNMGFVRVYLGKIQGQIMVIR